MEVIDDYIKYIKEKKKLSNNTINSYKNDLKKYIDYLDNNNIKIDNVVENDIISYTIKLEKENISVSTISRCISSIKSFHDYLFFYGQNKTDPSKNIKKPKMEKSTIDILTEKEIESLLEFKDLSKFKNIRDKAIFEVLYGTGIKVSELVCMNIEDIDLDIDYIYCNSGKNKRVIPLSDITKYYLNMYIIKARQNMVQVGENALFVNSFGQRFTRQGLWKVIKSHADKVKINKNINPTMLRHSFAIHLLNKGANIAAVSKILGNSNLASLQCYVHQIDSNIRREIREKHPRR